MWRASLPKDLGGDKFAEMADGGVVGRADAAEDQNSIEVLEKCRRKRSNM